MPKAKPLPSDPIEREKVLRTRERVKRGVINWRKAYPDRARVLGRFWKAAYRLKQRGKELARLTDAGI